jgi:hypothetical protein
MFHRHLRLRALRMGASAAAILLYATPVRGAPVRSTDVCRSAYQSAQEREQSGHMLEARELLATCAKTTCGRSLRNECAIKYTRLDSEIPSVVLHVTDDAGAARVDVQVRIDGKLLTSQVDGQALPVDPGVHEFSFSTETGVFATQKIMIAQGELNRPISMTLSSPNKLAQGRASVTYVRPATRLEMKAAPEKPPPDASPPPQTPAATEMRSTEDRPQSARSRVPYLLGAAGVASVGATAWLASSGKKDVLSLAGDAAIGVSMGVGVAALGAVAWTLVSSRSSGDPPPSRAACVFDVRPTLAGASVSVSGAF